MYAVCGEGGAPLVLTLFHVVLFWFCFGSLWFVFFRVWFSWSSVSADRTPARLARSDLPVAGALVRLVEEAMVSLMDEHVVIVGICTYVTEEIDT